MTRSLAALAALASLAVASQAMAGSPTFTGAYVGSGIGGGFGNARTESYFDLARGSIDNGLSGITGNVFAGYGQTVAGSVYVGVEGAFEASNFSWHNDNGTNGEINKIQKPYGLGAVGRLGYEFTPNFMLYGAGGIAYDRFRLSTFDFGSQQKWNLGYQFGGGAELDFGQGVFTRLSYQGEVNDVYFDAFDTKARVLTHSGKLAVGYRF